MHPCSDGRARRAQPPTVDQQSQSLIIDHRSALRAQNFLDLKAAEEATQVEDLSRKEFGSVEGQVTGVTTYYGKPALMMRARLSGREVKCVLPSTHAEAIGAERKWDEVWRNQRVIVSGLCHYERTGNLFRVDADDVSPVASRDVPVSELRDTTFSDGLTPQEHLDRLWGQDHG